MEGEFKAAALGDFPGVSVAKTPCSQGRGTGLVPDEGTRSHMLLQTWLGQIKSAYVFFKKLLSCLKFSVGK